MSCGLARKAPLSSSVTFHAARSTNNALEKQSNLLFELIDNKPKLMTPQFTDTTKTKISVIDVGLSVNPESNLRLLNTCAEKDSRE